MHESVTSACNKSFPLNLPHICTASYLKDILTDEQWDQNRVLYVTWNLIHFCRNCLGFPLPHSHCSYEIMSLLVNHGIDVNMPISWSIWLVPWVWHSVPPFGKTPATPCNKPSHPFVLSFSLIIPTFLPTYSGVFLLIPPISTPYPSPLIHLPHPSYLTILQHPLIQ